MKKLLVFLMLPLTLLVAACETGTIPVGGPVALVPGGEQVCAAINSDKFDLALNAYGAATSAIGMLIDARVLVPGTPHALAVANANDKVLAAFAVAQHARHACNSADYLAALDEVRAAIAEIRVALHS